jgi:hypothetical protein
VTLLDFARDEFSQNGEDGLIERIFDVVRPRSKACCEFGAWDGIHFSNTRKLLLDGWSGVQIEADPERFAELAANYADRPDVLCVERTVEPEGTGSLRSILSALPAGSALDLLSIDVDGNDFLLFSSLREWPADERPVLVVVEVSAGHSPDATGEIPAAVAAANIGQPLARFCAEAERLGYRLVAYTGNGFFLRADAGGEPELPTLSPGAAYTEHLARLDGPGREWLYRANLGRVDPYYAFENPSLSAQALGIPLSRRVSLCLLDAVHLPARLRALRGRRAGATRSPCPPGHRA